MPDRPSRNPDWAADELILALDLYLEYGMLDDADPRVIELSRILNALPIHTARPDLETFRNPNGVRMKLANFAALDPSHPGKGLSRHSRRDAEIWDRFTGSRNEVKRLADVLRRGATTGALPANPEPDEDEVVEGRLVYRLHRTLERKRSLVAKKKAAARAATGVLECEVCGFDFEARYGDMGHDYIECHHIVPLSATGERSTRLADLALVCANCHRMLHRRDPWPTPDELRAEIR